MGLGEPVFAETQNLTVDLLREFSRVAVCGHAGQQSLAVGFESAAAFPGGHRTAQPIGWLLISAAAKAAGSWHLSQEEM